MVKVRTQGAGCVQGQNQIEYMQDVQERLDWAKFEVRSKVSRGSTGQGQSSVACSSAGCLLGLTADGRCGTCTMTLPPPPPFGACMNQREKDHLIFSLHVLASSSEFRSLHIITRKLRQLPE